MIKLRKLYKYEVYKKEKTIIQEKEGNEDGLRSP